MTNSKVIQLVRTIITTAVGFVIVVLALQRVDTFLRYKALDDCAKVSRFEKENPADGTRVDYPMTDMYKACLQDKGLQ